MVKEIAFTAHPDGLGVCLLLAALGLAQGRRWRSAAMCLGLACGAKIFALALAPFVLVGAASRHWVLFGATLAALYAPFALGGGTDLSSLLVFTREWEFNSAAFGLLTLALPAFEAKLGLGWPAPCSGAGIIGGIVGTRGGPVPRGDWVYAYCWRPRQSSIRGICSGYCPLRRSSPAYGPGTASVAVLISYITGLNVNDYELQPYQQPLWARLLEFGLIALALAWPALGRIWRQGAPPAGQGPQT